MDLYQGISLGLLLAIGAETTYLAIKKPTNIKRKDHAATLLDTSVLIDGRIVSVAQAGFAGGTLIVPRSVVAELQYMADNADHDKRMRARYGLDVIQELQQMKDVTVEVLQDGPTKDVDAQLVILAKQHNAKLCTIDYNLNKVAQVEGIIVLNVNELAQALRTNHLPGETYKIQLVQKGSDSHQGVGYLEDGTMVVVEQSSALIGKEVLVEFTRVLQTQAGRMMFAKRVDDQASPQKSQFHAKPQLVVKLQKPVKKPQNYKKNFQTNTPQPQGQQPKAQQQAPQQQPQVPQVQAQQPQQPNPQVQQSAAQSSQPQRSTKQQPNSQQQQRRKRTSPEDSMVALANKQK